MNEPLSWYIAGPLIGLIVPLLLLLREKQFGISSSYRYLWSLGLKFPAYFAYNRKADAWQLQFVIGLIAYGFFHVWYFGSAPDGAIELPRIYGDFYALQHWPWFLVGGLLIGFGSRYANGCTAGHCIMGLSQFSLASLLATLGFFAGGLLVAWFLNPWIFR